MEFSIFELYENKLSIIVLDCLDDTRPSGFSLIAP
jgi:hypothetical protein